MHILFKILAVRKSFVITVTLLHKEVIIFP